MERKKSVLLLLFFCCSLGVFAQDALKQTRDFLNNEWTIIGKRENDLNKLIAIHRHIADSIQVKGDEQMGAELTFNNIFSVVAAANVIYKNVSDAPLSGETYFYNIVKGTDMSSDLFEYAFVDNIYNLRDYLYIWLLNKGEDRHYAMGQENPCNEAHSYRLNQYKFMMLEEVLKHCGQRLKDEFSYSTIELRLNPTDIYLDKLYPLLKAKLTDNSQKEQLFVRLDETRKLLPGCPAPDFALQDRKGKVYSLKDFEGKFLVIDMWATWCGGCVRNIGKFANIAKKYEGSDDIQFITISVDKLSSYYEWKYSLPRYGLMRMVSLLDPSGEQMYEKYKFTGVPRYLMIDPQGHIVDISLPGPYNASLENYIDEVITNYKKQRL